MPITQETLAEFAERRYVFVEKLVSEEDRKALYQRARARAETATMKADKTVPDTPAAYADPAMEDLLVRLHPRIEEITQLELFPTYSYFRVYKRGDTLQRHTDRFACEISVSINLGFDAAVPWPIWIEGPYGRSRWELNPGDAVIYRGIDCPHWREAFDGESSVQVFLHYVNQHGPQAEWKFDKRWRLGTMPMHDIAISERVSPVQPDGILEIIPNIKLRLNPLATLIMKDLEQHLLVPEIIQHATEKLAISRFAAESGVMEFLSRFGEKELLIF